MQKRLDALSESSFRFPCGDENGNGYYIAQGFQDYYRGYGNHLGLDINGVGGGNTDFGDPIYSIGDGIVAQAENEDYLSVYYKYNGKIIKAVYYHCKDIYPKAGDFVAKGEKIATIGNSNGIYWAHLHLELIKDTTVWAGFYGAPNGKFFDPIDLLPFYGKK